MKKSSKIIFTLTAMMLASRLLLAQAPIITSFTPSAALPNTTVTINGSGFAASVASSQVFFGAVKGTVLSATATQLTVKVPAYATNAPLAVENLTTNLSGSSFTNFTPLFDNNKDFGGRVIPAAMGLKNDLSLGASGAAQGVSLADLDGDGFSDLIVPQLNDSITIFRNKGNGLITLAGFVKSHLFTGTGIGNHQAITSDFDGDGKLDIAVIVRLANNDVALIYRNLSSPGALSFGPSFTVSLPILTINNADLAAGDMDGDGRPELILAASGKLSVFQNTGAVGNFSFAPKMDIMGVGSRGISLGDLDGDGKLDIAVAHGYYSTAGFDVIRNTSTLGTLSFGIPVTFAPINAGNINSVVLADLDGDGKLDISWVGAVGSGGLIVMRNVAVTGTLDASSFAAAVSYAEDPSILSYNITPWSYSQVADINGDGKPDFIGIGGTAQGFSISQNVGQSGVIDATSFLNGVLYQSSGSYATGPLAVGDLDGDGKPEVIVPYPNVSIYKNLTYPAPRIDLLKNSTVATQTGATGSSIFTQGDYQFANNNAPIVRFGSVASAVTSSTNTQVTTSVPLGASAERVAITLHGLTGFSPLPFTTTFATSGTLDATTFSTKVDYALTTSATGGLTVSDFDKDGKPDVAAGDGGNIKLFQNSLASAGSAISTSTLTALSTIATSIGSYSIVAGDFDGDGLTDLQAGSNIYHNNSGTQAQPISFEAGVQGLSGTSMNLAKAKTNVDFNHDGKADFISVNAPPGAYGGILVNENFSRNGSFIAGAGGSYYNFGTFNNAVSVYTSPTIGEPLPQTTAGDFDGDGYDDIVFLVKNTNELRSMPNTQRNRRITGAQFNAYQSTATLASPSYMVTTDFDQDGKLDVAVAYTSIASVSVFKNTSALGAISFSKQDFTSLANVVGIDAADLDGDGKVEIVTIHGTTTPFNFSILKNTSTTGISFATKIDYTLPSQPLGLALADMNLDSKPDVLITRAGLYLSVFQNQLTPPVITISTQPSAASVCSGTAVTFTTTAAGTSNIIYQWQFSVDGVAAYTDLINTSGYMNVATATLSINTMGNFGVGFYRCKIGGDFAATVYANVAQLTVTATPSVPTTTGASICSGTSAVVSASGGINGNYRWYTVASGGTAIAGQTNSSYTTPSLTATTTYYVSLVNGSCESARTLVTVTIITSGCANSPPVINAVPLATHVEGKIVFDLKQVITTANNNLDLASLQIVVPPSSGAAASIDAAGILTINYSGNVFSGTETISIKACDTNGNCATQAFNIDVTDTTPPDIIVYNGVSPNGDGKNDIFLIEYIDLLPDTKNNTVTIFDRWENQVWRGNNYDNSLVVFKGMGDGGGELPSGIYFYRIDFVGGRKKQTGFISLRR